MKATLSFLVIIICFDAYSQDSRIRSTPLDAGGYYKLLQALSPLPEADSSPLDTLYFVFSKAAADGILALKPHYLKEMNVADFVLPDPPANSSHQTRAELNFLLNLQAQRTVFDIESSKVMAGIYYPVNTKPGDTNYEAYRRNLFHIGRSVGTWFTPENLPVTADFFANVCKDGNYFIWQLKLKYARVRPYVLEQEIENLEETDWAAYPSGHASNAYITAFILQELAPDYGALFLRDAFDMTRSREILGVHYPSDGEAARLLARQFVDSLFTSEAFVSDFKKVQLEWKQRARETFERPVTFKTGLPDKVAAPCAAKCKSPD